MPSSKLREVTSGSKRGSSSKNASTEDAVVTGPRSSRSKKKMVEVDTSDDDNLRDQEEDEVGDSEDAPGEEDEDVDAEGDVDMDDAPPQPPASKKQGKPAVTATPAGDKPVKSVEAKEMEIAEDDDDDDDEELSELESDAEGEPDDQEETAMQDEEMGEGGEDEELEEEEEEEEEDDDDDDDDDDDSDEATPATRSRGSTPEVSRLTKRQRGTLGDDYLQLPMEPQVKKHLTAEEYAMRRAEMARRRKNLSEKRNEEEKMDTINRLLKKQAPKRRGRVPAAETAEATPAQDEKEPEKLDPTMVRWVSSRDSCRVGVPVEWFGTPAGRMFGDAPPPQPPSMETNGARKLVEEV